MAPSVVVLGSGITGLSVALALSRAYNVTIVARDVVGDNTSQGWASPWAGACFLPLMGSSEGEVDMQKVAFKYMWDLAETSPETSIKRTVMVDMWDEITDEAEVWYSKFMPNCRKMDASELPAGVGISFEYDTVIMDPQVYLAWIHDRLTAAGVKFVRQEIQHISELKSFKADVYVNAAGCGAKFLGGVEDDEVELIRGQTMLVRNDKETKIMIRHGKEYTYSLPRLDGTCILGGVKLYGNSDKAVDESFKSDILRRVHEITTPGAYPQTVAELDLIRDIVGIRPGRKSGVRVEKETIAGMKIVHAYGVAGGGYIFSAGVGRKAAGLVDELVYAI
ncbi:nucleotide-binding domain-containing protein [Hymenopellis radicata]|nr:nucleotide-binding domain-containing protein [Hymenopellis radicata]